MGLFDKIFGKKNQEKSTRELHFKSNIAAFEYELETNPCRAPMPEDLIMGLVLHSYKDGESQNVHLLTTITSSKKIEEELRNCSPSIEISKLPKEILDLFRSEATFVPRAICYLTIPELKVGDFVAVKVSKLGLPTVYVINVAEPTLNLTHGWKSRMG